MNIIHHANTREKKNLTGIRNTEMKDTALLSSGNLKYLIAGGT
jgi:hypothetical protein